MAPPQVNVFVHTRLPMVWHLTRHGYSDSVHCTTSGLKTQGKNNSGTTFGSASDHSFRY